VDGILINMALLESNNKINDFIIGRGRPRKEVDVEQVLDMVDRGMTQVQMAEELGISNITLARRIADIKGKQGLLLQYRVLQPLQLTELQARVLDAITPEKIEGASLDELVRAYKILKDKELVSTGNPTELKGLVHYLITLEKEEAACEDNSEKEFTGKEINPEVKSEVMPNL